jgi:hypothetical protein
MLLAGGCGGGATSPAPEPTPIGPAETYNLWITNSDTMSSCAPATSFIDLVAVTPVDATDGWAFRTTGGDDPIVIRFRATGSAGADGRTAVTGTVHGLGGTCSTDSGAVGCGFRLGAPGSDAALSGELVTTQDRFLVDGTIDGRVQRIDGFAAVTVTCSKASWTLVRLRR